MNRELKNESNQKIYEALFNILPYVFYKNISGIYLGVNTNQAKAFGFKQPSELIGKTIFEILEDKETAKLIDQVDNEVMQKGTTLVLEETINTPYGIKIFLTQKSPLYNEEGHITGMLGFATDITEFKEKQKRTDLELAKQSLIVEHQKNLITLAHTVAHDISSPLSALNMMMHACDELKENKRIVIKRATESILDIANNLLSTYRNEEQRATSDIEPRQPLLISDSIIQLLSEKKVQYSNHAVRFETEIANDAQFAFAQMQSSQFRRSLSNLINNAVDALTNNEHDIVTIKLTADEDFVVVEIHDNGKGMSSGMIEKMLNRQSFTEGKEHGHGLGLQQVWETLDNNQGTMTVNSTPGEGTTVQLTFPRIDAASWIAQSIHLVLNSIIVILDDEESIHGAWDTRFARYLRMYPTLNVHHFKQGQEALDFFKSLNPKDKDRVVFLSDYELLRQAKNGLQIIEESGIENTTLVTSYYANAQIRDRAIQLGVKILPKQMASIVPLEVDENRPVTYFLKAIRNRFSTRVS